MTTTSSHPASSLSDTLADFRQAIEHDAALQAEVAAAAQQGGDAFQQTVLRIGTERGYDFSELEAALSADSANDDELSLAELDKVVGGTLACQAEVDFVAWGLGMLRYFQQGELFPFTQSNYERVSNKCLGL